MAVAGTRKQLQSFRETAGPAPPNRSQDALVTRQGWLSALAGVPGHRACYGPHWVFSSVMARLSLRDHYAA